MKSLRNRGLAIVLAVLAGWFSNSPYALADCTIDAANPANVSCSGADTNGFFSTDDVNTLTIADGATVTDTAGNPSTNTGFTTIGLIDIFGPAGATSDVIGAIINNGTITITNPGSNSIADPGVIGLNVDGSASGSVTNTGTITGGARGINISNQAGGFTNTATGLIEASSLAVIIGGYLPAGLRMRERLAALASALGALM